jgi:Zn finger protein HypA/HybF involved in hydrogenase expression
MKQSGIEKKMGLQRLICKNPGCNYLLKEIYFIEGWTKRTNGKDTASLITNNGSSFYLCPKCKAKNIVIREGEKIILEKIISFELP